VAQELDGGGGENALLCVNHQTRLAQPRENFPQMLQVFLLVPAGYNDVIQVAEDEGEARQDAVHHPLEGVARIAQPEGHAAKLEQPERRQMAVFLMSAGCIGI
jgi:hypothetical protein